MRAKQVSPDSEGIEQTRTAGSKAKLPERGANPRSGFTYGRCERSELVRIAKELSRQEPQVRKRNFLSAEQIQEANLQMCFICQKSFVICHAELVSASVTFDKASIPSTAPRAKTPNFGVLVKILAVIVPKTLPSKILLTKFVRLHF